MRWRSASRVRCSSSRSKRRRERLRSKAQAAPATPCQQGQRRRRVERTAAPRSAAGFPQAILDPLPARHRPVRWPSLGIDTVRAAVGSRKLRVGNRHRPTLSPARPVGNGSAAAPAQAHWANCIETQFAVHQTERAVQPEPSWQARHPLKHPRSRAARRAPCAESSPGQTRRGQGRWETKVAHRLTCMQRVGQLPSRPCGPVLRPPSGVLAAAAE